jgi:uncharacterized protein (DUF4415 family)
MKDEDIICDDENPEWTPEMFARGVLRVGLKPVPPKTLLSLRIDADVVDWFRAQGPGYQSRMNALLRAYMEASQKQDSGGTKPPSRQK